MDDNFLPIVIGLAGFALCSALIALLLPFASRLSVAVPTDRSSHKRPTPQVGGLFVMATLVIILGTTAIISPVLQAPFLRLITPAVLLCVIGAIDDRRGLSPWLRLVLYFVIVGAYLTYFPQSVLKLFPQSEANFLLSALLLVGFINVTNFMDGVDGMIVAQFGPICIYLASVAAIGGLHLSPVFPVAMAGAMLGFFVFNKPVARIFLGDAGSVALGFLAGAILLDHAAAVGATAALILPFYFLADAGLTLVRRMLRGQRIWEAHRQHLYQQAFDAGQSTWSIIARVALCTLALCAVSRTAWAPYDLNPLVSVALAAICVGALAKSLSARKL